MNRAQLPMLTLFSMAPVVLLVSTERGSKGSRHWHAGPCGMGTHIMPSLLAA